MFHPVLIENAARKMAKPLQMKGPPPRAASKANHNPINPAPMTTIGINAKSVIRSRSHRCS
jgi:hypothetical protein